MISKGVDVVKVSKRLRHVNAKITLETYAYLVPNEDNDLADIFESVKIMGNSKPNVLNVKTLIDIK